ncbi:MAG: hypothetical protein KDE53_16965 [Caldilineaceae bacterium]|nr:hypothetical protein [Caldilineaceae bacterium]
MVGIVALLLGPWGAKRLYRKILGLLGRKLESTKLTRDPLSSITAICAKVVAHATNAITESHEDNNTLFFGGIGFCG